MESIASNKEITKYKDPYSQNLYAEAKSLKVNGQLHTRRSLEDSPTGNANLPL
jgi:hypothetical protein